MNELNNREQITAELKKLFDKGYRYVVRDKDMEYIACFSLKPKKYLDIEAWGYPNPDDKAAMMAHPIKNTDVTEIQWSNKSPMLISDYLQNNLQPDTN